MSERREVLDCDFSQKLLSKAEGLERREEGEVAMQDLADCEVLEGLGSELEIRMCEWSRQALPGKLFQILVLHEHIFDICDFDFARESNPLEFGIGEDEYQFYSGKRVSLNRQCFQLLRVF